MASPSGIPKLGDLPPGSHIGQFYWDQLDLVETLVPFFAAGLGQRERCIWICSPPLCARDARIALAFVVPDLEERERRGQIDILDHDEWYSSRGQLTPDTVIEGWLAAEEQALAAGYRGLRVSGNTFWLAPEEWQAFASYEARAHQAFCRRKIIALCSYALSKCSSQEVIDILHNHGASLVRNGSGWEVVHGATAALAALESDRYRVRGELARSVASGPVAEPVARPGEVQRASGRGGGGADEVRHGSERGGDGADELTRLRAELAQATAALADERAKREVVEAAYASARSAREHLVLLNNLTAALGEVTTRAQFVELVRDGVARSLDAPGIVVIEADARDLPPLVAHGIGADALVRAATIPVQRATWSDDLAQLGDAPAELRAFAVAPVMVGSRRLATMVLGFTRAVTFSVQDRALVEDIARQLALALDRAISYERLEQERARAESASRAKDEFLAMLGHELRNPLSPILTATQLMRLRAENVFDKERTVIERQVKHMIRLVDDLLDISRITRGKIELRRRPVEASEVIAQAVELASPAMEQRAHRLTLDVPPSGLVVHADPHRLAQVIGNLLNNAAKYTPHGGAIHVAAHRVDSTVTICVRDAGIGIDPKLLPHVFDLFVQGRQGIDRAAGGLGLGLAIARTLVELHGGTIRAHSGGPGQGSEFVVELPRYANTRPAVRNASSGAFELAVMRSRRVLVVDDNEDAAFLFSEALRKLGHQVDVAHDGPSALAVARQRPPEIAFLDIGLPVMDGYELGRRLKALFAVPPKLVAVTGYGHSSDRVRSREAGFDLHLVKPVDLTAIQDALAKLGS